MATYLSKSWLNTACARRIAFCAARDGGAEGVRTPDLLNAIQALYQLSYDPIRSAEKCKRSAELVKTNLGFWTLKFRVRTLACGA